ncbi:MAG: ComF family protein [Nitrospinae bacterium]|nr:ComF family protein [Nitrospinota bacterium]
MPFKRVNIFGGILRGFRKILDFIFPQNCISCEGNINESDYFLCSGCRGDIGFIRQPYCFRCGIPADISYENPHEEFVCGECRQNTCQFDQARSLGFYDTVLRKAIHHFKYRRQMGVLPEVDRLLKKYFDENPDFCRGFTVSPVPLHFNKMKERGFDQAFLIARQVAMILKLPLEGGLLRRVRETSAQANMTRMERAKNIKGAFEVNRPELVEGKNILLVDDVFTTGATVNEAAGTLKKNGAGTVHVFTLGRVVVGKSSGL